MAERNYHKYQLKKGRRVIHRGITNDLRRREAEHQTEFSNSRILQIGRRTTKEAALNWERRGGKRPYNH